MWSGKSWLSRPDLFNQGLKNGTSIQFEGRITFWEHTNSNNIYYLDQCSIIDSKKNHIQLSKILVYFKTDSSFQSNIYLTGDMIQGVGTIYDFEHASNPGQFDQFFYYQKNNYCASINAAEITMKQADSDWMKEKTTMFRQWWKQELITDLGEHYGNIMSAIFLGDKHELDADVKELYQKNGIGHILAISGLHMSFLGIGIYQILRRCGVGFCGAGMAGILFLIIYYMMIGESVSAFRALIMFVVKIGAEITGRTYDMLTSIAIAVVVILIWRPMYLWDSGFLLSFCAILGIAIFNNELKKTRIPRIFIGGISIQIMTFPWMLYFYYEMPIYSVLINLIVIPLMSVVFACGVTAPIVGVLWKSGRKILLTVCAGILMSYEKLCESTFRTPLHRIVTGQPPKWLIVIYYLALFLLLAVIKEKLILKKMKKKKTYILRRGLQIACIFSAILMIFGGRVFQNHDLKIVMLDVGQGDALYMQTPAGGNILIDGGSSTVTDVGKYRVEPFLKSRGVSKLDYIFVSHGDEDHISGISEMLENQKYGVRIETIVLPEERVMTDALWKLAALAKEYDTKVAVIKENETIRENDFLIKCISPSKDEKIISENAASMVLSVQYKAFKMLFTGDFEGNENMLASKAGTCTVLKVAHHGSKNSTTTELLEVVKPKVALISSGKNNRYGHPHKETIDRLKKYTKRIYNTQSSGAIEIQTDGNTISIDEYIK